MEEHLGNFFQIQHRSGLKTSPLFRLVQIQASFLQRQKRGRVQRRYSGQARSARALEKLHRESEIHRCWYASSRAFADSSRKTRNERKTRANPA